MARQKGAFRLVGTIGGVNYYRAGGEYYSRKAGGGFSKSAIKNKSSMQKVREFNDEFASCVAAKKAFRVAVDKFIGDLRSLELQNNMMRLFLELKNLDHTNPVGRRKVGAGLLRQEGRRLVKEFIFLPELDVNIKSEHDRSHIRILFQDLNKSDFDLVKVRCGKLEGDLDLANLELRSEQEYSFINLPISISYSENGLLIIEMKCFKEGKFLKRGVKLLMVEGLS